MKYRNILTRNFKNLKWSVYGASPAGSNRSILPIVPAQFSEIKKLFKH